MYMGVDIGGTKTLVAALSDDGVITEQVRFPTPRQYEDFLKQLREAVGSFKAKDFRAAGLAMPVTVFDRTRDAAVSFGNLPWRNVPIHNDVEQLLGCPVAIENDAKLGGLSEAMLLKDKYRKVLYVTVSTGIGYGLVVDEQIDANAGDAGGRAIMFEHGGKVVSWESFASGRAIVERYGKQAKDITDEDTWRRIARDLAQGFLELIAIFQPEVIVIGGSVGAYFDRYGSLLTEELKRYDLPLVPIPPIIGAKRADEAVVYGCYDYAKQLYGHGSTAN